MEKADLEITMLASWQEGLRRGGNRSLTRKSRSTAGIGGRQDWALRVGFSCGRKWNIKAYKMCMTHGKCLTMLAIINIITSLGSWWNMQGSGQSFTRSEGSWTPNILILISSELFLPPLPSLLLFFYCIYSQTLTWDHRSLSKLCYTE